MNRATQEVIIAKSFNVKYKQKNLLLLSLCSVVGKLSHQQQKNKFSKFCYFMFAQRFSNSLKKKTNFEPIFAYNSTTEKQNKNLSSYSHMGREMMCI